MKSAYFVVLLAVFLGLPTLSQAEIYKWKDKDGNTRYSDTPPPSNIKLENIGTKKPVTPTGRQPLSPANSAPAAVAAPVPNKDVVFETPQESPEDLAAKQRQQNAETEKNNRLEKEAQAKLKAENCKAARANLASYDQGGRIYKMNEKGEREYMDDAALKQGADRARSEVAQYCN